jgi:hypothetical protein
MSTPSELRAKAEGMEKRAQTATGEDERRDCLTAAQAFRELADWKERKDLERERTG